jgi:hypothetical protein
VVNAQAERLIELQEKSDVYMSYLNEYVTTKDGAFSRRMEQHPDNWKTVEEGGSSRYLLRGSSVQDQYNPGRIVRPQQQYGTVD